MHTEVLTTVFTDHRWQSASLELTYLVTSVAVKKEYHMNGAFDVPLLNMILLQAQSARDFVMQHLLS